MIKNKKLISLIVVLVMSVICSITIFADVPGWDRTDYSFTTADGIYVEIWNSCSDGSNQYYPAGHCVTTYATEEAILKIEASGSAYGGSFSYTRGPWYDWTLAEDGGGLPTYYIRSVHYIDDTSKTIFSSNR